MTRLSMDEKFYFTADQAECVLNFAVQVAGSRSALRGVTYHVLGMEDLAKKDESADLLRCLQSQDWEAASRHSELAGRNNLLVALLVHVDAEGQGPHGYWVALRSPFEYLDSASLMACGKVNDPPHVPMSVLPLESSR